jgi:hypothetical protein
MAARFGRLTKDLSDRLALVVAMPTRITVLCILLLILGAIADGNAAFVMAAFAAFCFGFGYLMCVTLTGKRVSILKARKPSHWLVACLADSVQRRLSL